MCCLYWLYRINRMWLMCLLIKCVFFPLCSYSDILLEREVLMQKYIHLVQIVETEKISANQLRHQLEDQDTEIERLKSEVGLFFISLLLLWLDKYTGWHKIGGPGCYDQSQLNCENCKARCVKIFFKALPASLFWKAETGISRADMPLDVWS